MPASDAVLLETDGGIATVTLNRPEKLNAFTAPMRDELVTIFRQLDVDPKIRVIVLTGAGRGFCSGADLSMLDIGGDASPPWRLPGAQDILSAVIHRSQKPVICALNGVAAGAGISIALACDIRIASTAASLAFVFFKRNVNPDYGCSYHLARILGKQRAFDILTRDHPLAILEAERLGLVLETVEPDELLSRAQQWAVRLASVSPVTLSIAKHTMNAAATLSLEQTIALEGWGNIATDALRHGGLSE